MFLALLTFLVTFLVTRIITRMIRAGKGPFGNVSAGSVHVHHVVPGLIILLCGGVLALGAAQSSIWRQLAGVMFGMGAALVLDEFAMILHMDDVYWTSEGPFGRCGDAGGSRALRCDADRRPEPS